MSVMRKWCSDGSRYSRMDQVKLVEDSLGKIWSDMVRLGRPYPFKSFNGCLPQIYLVHSWIPWPRCFVISYNFSDCFILNVIDRIGSYWLTMFWQMRVWRLFRVPCYNVYKVQESSKPYITRLCEIQFVSNGDVFLSNSSYPRDSARAYNFWRI